jgi:hypothetical protein
MFLRLALDTQPIAKQLASQNVNQLQHHQRLFGIAQHLPKAQE